MSHPLRPTHRVALCILVGGAALAAFTACGSSGMRSTHPLAAAAVLGAGDATASALPPSAGAFADTSAGGMLSQLEADFAANSGYRAWPSTGRHFIQSLNSYGDSFLDDTVVTAMAASAHPEIPVGASTVLELYADATAKTPAGWGALVKVQAPDLPGSWFTYLIKGSGGTYPAPTALDLGDAACSSCHLAEPAYLIPVTLGGSAPAPAAAVSQASAQPPAAAPAPPAAPGGAAKTELDAFDALPTGAAQLKVLCARAGQDKVRQVLCGPTPPAITGLTDLQKALGIAITDPTLVGRNNNGTGGNAAFALTAGSSSLVVKATSAINPRLVLFTPPGNAANPALVAMGFVRGEQFAEVVAGDPASKALAFFLVRFTQACNGAPKGCAAGDLLTPAIEKNWQSVTVYEDTDLRNTIFDCLQCHQPQGPASAKMLRMQELQNPWTHFFRDNTSGGPALIADFQAAHGTLEDYAGIPAAMISSSNPALLQNLVQGNGFTAQPNVFPTRQIEQEVQQSDAAQPADNTTPGTSTTWAGLYANAVAGKDIPPPYHDVKVTDKVKLAAATQAYQAFLAGTLPAAQLPDIRAVLPSGPQLRDMSLMVQAGLTGPEIVTQACSQCHNSLLAQDISRAKFNADLTLMDQTEKDLAVQRLQLPDNDPKKMPPARFRTLSADEITTVIQTLKQ